jgi:hypothetical protein
VGTAGEGERATEIVVVPRAPGPLVALDAPEGRRRRDDLDDLIDELFPDVDERAGWFDAALLVGGAALIGWRIAGGPTFALLLGIGALAVGCILPIRAAWRSLRARLLGRRRAAALATGHPLDTAAPETARLVAAYHDLVALADHNDLAIPAIAAAHSALLDSASLLVGRLPATADERSYVEDRAAAVEALAEALHDMPPTGADSAALLEARNELDELTQSSSVRRIEALIDEAKLLRGPD